MLGEIADVGVSLIAVLNAVRILSRNKIDKFINDI